MAKIYIAGKFEEHEQIKQYADRLRSCGHEITEPWFERKTIGPAEYSVLESEAIADMHGVFTSDFCIFIFEKELPYKGACTELGLALAWNKPVIVVGNGCKHNVFLNLSPSHGLKRVETFEDAINIVSLKCAA